MSMAIPHVDCVAMLRFMEAEAEGRRVLRVTPMRIAALRDAANEITELRARLSKSSGIGGHDAS